MPSSSVEAMTPDIRKQVKSILDALDKAVEMLRDADNSVLAADEAVGDGNGAIRQMLDAQTRAIEAHRIAIHSHGVAIDMVRAANRAAVELLNQSDA